MPMPPRLSLAHLPTPIHLLPRISAELGLEVYVWRDDLTGFVESGNKVRKLEFLLADALAQGATRIITAGAVQSNHTRATAWCARRLGLQVTIVVREPRHGHEAGPATGNLLLNQIAGADLRFIPAADYQKAGSAALLAAEGERARQAGERPYLIPPGGSVPLGCWGYLEAVGEMLETWRRSGPGTPAPDALFFAVGSGGTHAGLFLGYERHGLPAESLWAVNVSGTADKFRRSVGALIQDTCTAYGLPRSGPPLLQVLDGHVGKGYALATDGDLRFYCELARREGLLLDPAYCGKAFRGMIDEVRRAPGRFGRRILFLNSGGGFSIFAYPFARVLQTGGGAPGQGALSPAG